MTKSEWKRVSKRHPCPICDHPDWCTVSENVACCMRVESPKPAKNGGWIHRLNGEAVTEWERVPVARKPMRTDLELDDIWRPRVMRWRDQGRSEVGRLALSLGVSVSALQAIQTGWDGKAWTFPERNGAALIVGVSRRFEDGSKRCAVGSRRGLTYAAVWDAGPVLIVEGASDVAAGMTLGLATVGRLSNRGGLGMLVALFGHHFDRELIVIGERDQKDPRALKPGQDPWPGWNGAKAIAAGLGKKLGRIVSARLLPDEAKDLRAWLKGTGVEPEDKKACRRVGKALVNGW